ncbi:MAG: hypothetical protein ACE5GT_14390, partial [Rhodospirillales bacterium]
MTTFFVGGCARAGTSLLQAVLSADETTNPLMAEATNFNAVINAYAHGKDEFEKSVGDFFADRDALKAFYADT